MLMRNWVQWSRIPDGRVTLNLGSTINLSIISGFSEYSCSEIGCFTEYFPP